MEDYFGVVYASIESPEDILGKNLYPILPFKLENRVYNPQGKWNGWYFSEELKFAKLNGYKINVHFGYNFEFSTEIFKNYVETYYHFKKVEDSKIDKNSSKLLLNSLYGRFGLNDKIDVMGVFNSEESKDILSRYTVKDQYSISEDLEFLRYEKVPYNNFQDNNSTEDYLKLLVDCDNKNRSLNHSIPIAIATAAYARIYMFKIIHRLEELGINIYYMDTDSLVIDQDMPQDLVGDKIGQFKLEHEIEEGIFIDPKFYCLKLSENNYIFKNKGLVNSLSMDEYKHLLEGGSLTLTENRQFKNIKESLIKITSIDINLKTNFLKRNPVKIDSDPKNIFTVPFTIKNNEILK